MSQNGLQIVLAQFVTKCVARRVFLVYIAPHHERSSRHSAAFTDSVC
jgi:hypothetical protein